MTLTASPASPPRMGALVAWTLIGGLLVWTGLATAYLAVATPVVSMLAPGSSLGGRAVAIGFGIWSFSMVAGGALLVAGTNRLALILAILRTRDGLRGPAARALAGVADELVVVGEVLAGEGPPIP